MSFNRATHLESQPTTFRRDDDPQYSDDPEFQRFTTSLSEKLFSLTSNMSQLSREISYLGTKRETERVRERVQDLIEETGAGYKEVGEGLKKVSNWPDLGPQQRYTQSKLNSDFRASIGEFQVLSRQALEKQRASKTALEQEQNTSASQDPGQGQQTQLQEQQQEQRLANQSEVDFQESLIVERESEIRQIEQSVGELNELFRDVATMVHDQGTQLLDIESNVTNTATDTRGADQELRQANKYQKNARSKACCLLLILAVVLIVVVLASVYG
ncbi:MAG: hypothetical protein M1828_007338 [Chrysothrix sp. TS-e1954]|nr:MAG: hypothetical protein M1828_007338 [Chrysothrix sp. TS-e1954]